MGMMYLMCGLLMFVGGGIEGVMMGRELGIGKNRLLEGKEYNEVFSREGVIMIMFMGMGLIFGLWNVIVGLEIGGGDVGFGVLNKVSLWLLLCGMLLLKV